MSVAYLANCVNVTIQQITHNATQYVIIQLVVTDAHVQADIVLLVCQENALVSLIKILTCHRHECQV